MPGVGLLGELDVIDFLSKEKKHTIYIPLKDKGIDFISVNKNKFYRIQVKTSMFQKNSYFWFDLHESKLIFSKNMFYILVCKSLGRREFMGRLKNLLIIPSLKLKKWIEDGSIARKESDKRIFNIFVYPDPKNRRWIYRNKGKKIDLTKFWNNIKCLDY